MEVAKNQQLSGDKVEVRKLRLSDYFLPWYKGHIAFEPLINYYRENLSEKLLNHLSNDNSKGRSKDGSKGAFTRDRKLPFEHLIVSLLTMGNSSLQREMDKFLHEAHSREFTKSAFSQSRKQLKLEAFLELNGLVCNGFYEGAPYLGYNNHRVLGLADFKEVYHLRWGIEEGFKMFKSRANIEAFTGKPSVLVKQDIYAKAMMMSLCAAFAFLIEQKVKAEYAANRDLKHLQKINWKTADANTKAITISMFLKSKIKQAIAALDDIVYNTREIVRPNRKNPRNHRPKQQHYMNYKQL